MLLWNKNWINQTLLISLLVVFSVTISYFVWSMYINLQHLHKHLDKLLLHNQFPSWQFLLVLLDEYWNCNSWEVHHYHLWINTNFKHVDHWFEINLKSYICHLMLLSSYSPWQASEKNVWFSLCIYINSFYNVPFLPSSNPAQI